MIPLSFISKYDVTVQENSFNPNITVTVQHAQSMNYAITTVEAYLKSAKQTIESNFGGTTGDLEEIIINNVPFLRMKNEMTMGGKDIAQYQYVTKIGDYFVAFALSDSSSMESMPILIEAMETFDKLK